MSLTAQICLLLSEWISSLLTAVPPRSRRTFVELLIGCMLNPEGWVTRAIGAIRREAHWTTYYKLIERVHISVIDLSVRLPQLMQMLFSNELTRQALGGETVDRPGQGACQRSALADRCMVHAQEFNFTFARTKDAHHRPSAARYGPVSAAGTGANTPWAEAQIQSAYRCGRAGYAVGTGEGADTVRQNAAGQAALGHRRGATPQGCDRAGGVVRDASGRQHLIASAIDFGDRDGTLSSSRGGNLRRAMGYRAIVPQLEAVVGWGELVAATEGRAGTVDADSLHDVCPDTNARPEAVGIFPVDGNRA